MEILRRWTSPSVFLLLALNIRYIFGQNVGPDCPYPVPQSFQEPLRDCNQGFVSPQLQTNNLLYPPNGFVPGGPIGPILDYQRPLFKDGLLPQTLPFNQQANIVPGPCAKLGQGLQGQLCAGPPGISFNNQGPLLPFPIPQQTQFPIAPTNPPFLSQLNQGFPPLELLQPPQGTVLPGMLPGPCTPIMAPPFLPLSPTQPQGIGLPCSQGSLPFSQFDPLPVPNDPLLGNHFTPLVPIVNPGSITSFVDIPPPQVVVSPLTSPQGPIGMGPPFSPFLPLNNQGFSGTLIDTNSLGPCSPVLNVPQIQAVPPANLAFLQAPIQEAAQGNLLRQGQVFSQRCDIPESQLGTLTANPCTNDQSFQNSSPFSPFNMLRFPRPTLFPKISSFQSPLATPCDAVCENSPIVSNQGSVCTAHGINQQEPTSPQVPIGGYPFIPTQNIPPYLPNQNLPIFPLSSPPVFQPPLNSGYCPLPNNEATVNILPPQLIPEPLYGLGPVLPQISYSVDCTPNPTLITSPWNIGSVSALLPTPISIPTCENPSQSTAREALPVPINLQINVPPPTVPAPRITIINAVPEPSPAVSSADDYSFFDTYALPPMIIEGRRSNSRSWLPLFLVALFADGGFGGNDGGCSCDSGPIPVPYPIPIPTNNPVIVNN